MTPSDRIISGLKTVLLIEERVSALGGTVKDLKSAAEAKLADHEQRLIKLETVVEIVRPADGAILRIAPPPAADSGS